MKVKAKTNRDSAVFSLENKLIRALWAVVYITLFRFSPPGFFAFRRLLLRAFGAGVGRNVLVYPSVKIWLPSNLVLEESATLGPNVNVYNQGKITLGRNTIVSQGAHLCASTHDYNDKLHPLILAPIIIENDVWVCADAFVGPNVTLHEGCVVGARSVVTKRTIAFGVYGGNPAKFIKNRELNINE
jgi:putative colanic acid biosynthesis acetyltransferase WcaF